MPHNLQEFRCHETKKKLNEQKPNQFRVIVFVLGYMHKKPLHMQNFNIYIHVWYVKIFYWNSACTCCPPRTCHTLWLQLRTSVLYILSKEENALNH